MSIKKPKAENSLAKLNPDLAKQWHPTKNGELTPLDVTVMSNKRVWWKCPKGNDHEWITAIYNRSNGRGCPVCLGRKVVKSNCLATQNPSLAEQWHPTKNGNLTPSDVTTMSNKKVWWKCPKGDDHEWIADIAARSNGTGCPICANKTVVRSNCLATINPSLAKEWHPTKNGNLTPFHVTAGSHKKVWWKCPKGDDHEWKAAVRERNLGRGCKICANRIIVQSNSLATLNPELAKEWHPIKNGKLNPHQISPLSEKRVWWKCPKGDDHEWRTGVAKRHIRGHSCPICSNQKTVKSNSLATLNPELAKEWHPIKNKKLTPNDVGPRSNKVVWWKCPKGDDHEWRASVNTRSQGHGCGVCANRIAVPSNCLATLDPELSLQWHPTKNGKLTPNDIVPYSHKKVWWKCPKGDDHEWQATVKHRSFGTGCPMCRKATSVPELRIYCELKSLFESVEHRTVIKGHEIDVYLPNLNVGIEYDGEYWHRNKIQKDLEKNKALGANMLLIRIREQGLPKLLESDILTHPKQLSVKLVKKILDIILGSQEIKSSNINKKIEQYYQRKDWAAPVLFNKLFAERNGLVYEKSLGFLYPELSKQWHPIKNGLLLPEHYTPGSEKIVWWIDNTGEEWQERINYRVSKVNRRRRPNQLKLFKK